MLKKRIVQGILAALVSLAAGLTVLHHMLRPPAMGRSEIFQGVFLTVRDLPSTEHGKGRVMIAEVHWDTPGVRITNRKFSYPVNPDNPDNPHYRLSFADWAILSEDASLLVNTALYQPDSIYRILPGLPVRSLDTLVVDGSISHVHPHSYLLYWDTNMRAHMLLSKPPDPSSLDQAQTGIGMGGIQVVEGRPAHEAIADHERVMARTFIGVDPLRNILYLIAFENASAYLMIDIAVESGVIFGGQMDSGRSTNLLIGKQARGVGAHRGIRRWRPLGPYLTIQADPLP